MSNIIFLASLALLISLEVSNIDYFGLRVSANLNPRPLFAPVIKTFLNLFIIMSKIKIYEHLTTLYNHKGEE